MKSNSQMISVLGFNLGKGFMCPLGMKDNHYCPTKMQTLGLAPINT